MKTAMKLLFDTHFFLWVFIEPKRFSKKARKFVENTEDHDFFLSYASSWETSIKFGLGKLKLPQPPKLFIPERIRFASYSHLPIELEHVLRVNELPLLHRDPFDRLLVSQAIIENLTILTVDPAVKMYGVDTLSLADISK